MVPIPMPRRLEKDNKICPIIHSTSIFICVREDCMAWNDRLKKCKLISEPKIHSKPSMETL